MSGKAFIHRKAKNNEFYTPFSMTEQLLEKEFFNPTASFLEPACGALHMALPLSYKFDNLTIYDKNNEEFYGDFYQETRSFDYIITNPPYGAEADKFVEKAKKTAKHKFAFLLRTNYLSGQFRFDSGVYEGLRTIYIFSRMPDLTAEIRLDGKYPTAGIVYAWLVWEIGYKGKPTIDWIDNQKYVLRKCEA